MQKYINFPYKDLKEHDNFKYHFHFNQTDILTKIGGFEIHTFMRKIKKLKDLDYIDYQNSYSPRCVLRRTTLWWLNLEKIYKDFGIDLSTKAPKDAKATTPDHTTKGKQKDRESTPTEQDSSIPKKETDTDNTVFDFSSLNDNQKRILNSVLNNSNKNTGLKLLNEYSHLFKNKGKELEAFTQAYKNK
jgi:hypothetical protein